MSARVAAAALLTAAACAAAGAAFLHALAAVTAWRLAHPAILWALPLAGWLLGAVWSRWGRPLSAGTRGVLQRLHGAPQPVPPRMAPMVVGGTLWTHLFGGSAGREGTAVQMGASLGETIAKRLRVPAGQSTQLVATGVAAGFGAVFGAPLAGAVFALEAGGWRRPSWRLATALVVCAHLAHAGALGLGAPHSPWPQLERPALAWQQTPGWLALAVAVAVVARLWLHAQAAVTRQFQRIGDLRWRLASGALAVVVVAKLPDAETALGLSTAALEHAVGGQPQPPLFWAVKAMLTVLTVGAGFVGGEVTPLLVTGAALGSTLAGPLGLPVALAAAAGMAALLATVASVPLSLVVLAVEWFGWGTWPHVPLVCALAWLLRGSPSLYAPLRAQA